MKLEHEIVNPSWFSLGEVRLQVDHDVIHVFEQIVSIVSDRAKPGRTGRQLLCVGQPPRQG